MLYLYSFLHSIYRYPAVCKFNYKNSRVRTLGTTLWFECPLCREFVTFVLINIYFSLKWIQLNLLWREYESSPLVFFVKGYPTARMVFPLFWTESGYETLPQSEIDQLSLITPVSVVSTSCYIISIFMLLGVVLVLRGRLGFCVISGILWGDDEENILSDQNLKGEGKSDFGDKEEIPLNWRKKFMAWSSV